MRWKTCPAARLWPVCAGAASTIAPSRCVSEIRRDAERRFREKEQTLVAQLKELQDKVAKMETKGGEGGTSDPVRRRQADHRDGAR